MPKLTVSLEPRLLPSGRKRVVWQVSQSTGESVEGEKPAMLKLLRGTVLARLAEGFDVTARVYAASGALEEMADYHPDGSVKYHHVPPPEGEHGFGRRCRQLVETEQAKAKRLKAARPSPVARTLVQRFVAAMDAGERSGMDRFEAGSTFISVLDAKNRAALLRRLDAENEKGNITLQDAARARKALEAAGLPAYAPPAAKPPKAPPKPRAAKPAAVVEAGPPPDPKIVAKLHVVREGEAPAAKPPKAPPKPRKPRTPKAPAPAPTAAPPAAPGESEDTRMERMFGKLIELKLAQPPA